MQETHKSYRSLIKSTSIFGLYKTLMSGVLQLQTFFNII